MAAPGRKYTVWTKKDGLYLREKPTKESRILRLIPNGATVTVDPSADTPFGWYAVKGGGYVMADFLEAVEDPVMPEISEAPRRGRKRKSVED